MRGAITSSRMFFFGILLSVLAVGAGCMTFYYKEFVVSGTPRYPNQVVHLEGLLLAFQVDARPSDAQSYRDSIYFVNLSLIRDQAKCNDQWIAAIQSAVVREFFLVYDNSNVNMQERFKKKELAPSGVCWVQWDYEKIMIPDIVDTVRASVVIQYQLAQEPIVLDTTIDLYRLTGKEKEIWKD